MLNRFDLLKMKETKEKITMVTAYDYPSARLAEKAGIDTILVGDSLGMVVLGYDSTVQVTVEQMIHHAQAVRRGAPNTMMIVDMPFMSYHASLEDAIKNATRIFQQTDAQALKVEGASKDICTLIEKLADGGIPIVAHIGLTPQTFNILGGFKVQGRNQEAGKQLLRDAKALAQAGAIALVLEGVPKQLAEIITNEIDIPTIGIGAGIHVDGQVLVYHDLLQYGVDRLAKFVKTYAHIDAIGEKALKQYIDDVKQIAFPQDEHSYHIKDEKELPK